MDQDKATQTQIAKLLRVEQKPETWLYSIRRAPSWVTPKKGRPYRPFLLLLVDERTETVLTSRMEDEATPAAAWSNLVRAVTKPLFGAGPRRRPTEVRVNREDIAQALAPLLAQIGVRCTYQASLPQADDAVYSLATFLNKEEPPRGLLSEPGVTVPLVSQFYIAAAEYYRHTIWRWIDDSEPIEVQYSGEDRSRYAVIMGHGGEAYGLALYESLDDLDTIYGADPSEGATMQIPTVAVLYEEPMAMTFEDLDDLEAYGWPIAGEKAYPAVHKVVPGAKTTTTPTVTDLSCVIAILSALPHFVMAQLHAQSGSLQEARVTYDLAGALHGLKVTLHYPVYEPAEGNDESFEKLKFATLEAYIRGWYTDDATHALAREVGSLLLDFVTDLAGSGLTRQTVERHMKNAWFIGWLVCHDEYLGGFTPAVLTGEPKYLAELEKQFSPAPTARASYQATWRKLSRFIGAMSRNSDLSRQDRS